MGQQAKGDFFKSISDYSNRLFSYPLHNKSPLTFYNKKSVRPQYRNLLVSYSFKLEAFLPLYQNIEIFSKKSRDLWCYHVIIQKCFSDTTLHSGAALTDEPAFLEWDYELPPAVWGQIRNMLEKTKVPVKRESVIVLDGNPKKLFINAGANKSTYEWHCDVCEDETIELERISRFLDQLADTGKIVPKEIRDCNGFDRKMIELNYKET